VSRVEDVSSPSIQELVRAARKTVRDEIDAVEAEIARHLLAKYNPDQPRDERGRFGSGNGESSSSAEGKIPKFKTWDDVKEWGEKNDIRIDTKALADESHMTPEAMARVCGRIDAMDAKFPGLKKELTRIDSYPNAGKSTLAATRSDNMTAGSFQVHLGSSLLIPAKLGDAYANPEEFKASMLGNLKFSNNGAPRWSSCFGDSPDDTINHELGHVIQNMMSADGRLAEPKSNWNTKTNPYVAAASDAGWLTRTGKTSQGSNISFGVGYNISAYASTNPMECHAEALSLMQRPDLLAQMSQEQQDSFKVYVESLNKRAGTTVIKEQAEDTSGGIIEDDFGLSDEFWQQFYDSVNKKTNKANATDTLKAWLAKYNPDEERDSSGKWTSGGGDEEAPKVMDWQRMTSGGGSSSWPSYETRNKAADWMESHVDSVISMGSDVGSEPLTRAELEALDHYRQSGYEDLNDHLRAGGSINNDPDGIGKTLQGAFQHSETNEPVVVFRGLTKFQPDANVGDVITDRGFPSTTLAESVARQTFSENQAESQVMQINLPTGTPAIGIAGYESEILLPAGSQFRVDAKPDANGGKWVVTYVGQAAVKLLAKAQAKSKKSKSRFAWEDGDIEISRAAKKAFSADEERDERGRWTGGGIDGRNLGRDEITVKRGLGDLKSGDFFVHGGVIHEYLGRNGGYHWARQVNSDGTRGEMESVGSTKRVALAEGAGVAQVSEEAVRSRIKKGATETLKAWVAKYSPDEERDERGRWTGGDGTSMSSKEIADRIAAGKSTTIDRSQVADLAKYVASHEDPATRANPQYDKGDLTKLHLTDGKDVFAQGSKTGMYQRSEMPQIPGSAKPALLESLSQAGIGVTREQVDPSGLKPSQRDYSIAGASGQHEYLDSKGMFGSGVTPKDSDRILVSKDNYIIDGHHRWAAYQMEAMSNPDVKIPVIRIGATRDELIGSGDANGIINKFADSKGLERRGLGVVSRSAASKAIRVHGDIEFDSDDPRDKTFLDHLDRLGDKDQNAKPFVWNKDHPVEDFGDATKGDVAGHEFHGNQWTGGGGDGERAMPANDSTRMDNAPESVQQLDRQVGEGSEYKQFVTENDNGSGCDDIAQAVERDFGIKQVYGTFTTKDGTTEDHSWNVTPEGWIVDGAQYVFNQNGDSSSRFNYYAPGAPQFKEGTGWQFKSESPAIKGDVAGHEFHGNQWTGGEGGGESGSSKFSGSDFKELTPKEARQLFTAKGNSMTPDRPDLAKAYADRQMAKYDRVLTLSNGAMLKIEKDMPITDKKLETVKNAFANLQSKYPDKPRTVAIEQSPHGRKEEGSSLPGGDFIRLTRLGVSSASGNQENHEKNVANGYHAPAGAGVDNTVYTLTHEWGHTMDHVRGEPDSPEVRAALRNSDQYRTGYAKEGDTYTKRSETYAEAFTEYTLSGGKTENVLAQKLAAAEGWKA